MSGMRTTTTVDGSSTLRGRIRSAVGSVTDRVRGDEQPNPDRRAFLRKTGATGLAVAAGASATSGEAAALGGQCDVSRTDDSNLPWSSRGLYGGWGGADYWGDSSGVERTPVVFVHGNLNDACNWDTIATHLYDEGWNGDELWSITFSEGTTNHAEMKVQLDDFVQNVMSRTGQGEVHLVAHSLGVTGVRNWMDEYDRHGWVGTFVGLAGANHGVCICPGCYDTTLGGDYSGIFGAGEACQYIAVQCFSVPGHPLYEINLPDETPGDVDYYMMRGIYDPLFYCNVFSPYLDGAENDYEYTDHNGMLEQDDEIAERLPEDPGGSDDDSGGWYGWW